MQNQFNSQNTKILSSHHPSTVSVHKAQRVEFGLFDSTHPWVPGEFDLAAVTWSLWANCGATMAPMVEIHGCKDESGGFSTFRRLCNDIRMYKTFSKDSHTNTKGPKQSSFSFISGIASTAPWDESKQRQRYMAKRSIRSRRVVYWQYLLFSSSRI